jgi:hypothetical protein
VFLFPSGTDCTLFAAHAVHRRGQRETGEPVDLGGFGVRCFNFPPTLPQRSG